VLPLVVPALQCSLVVLVLACSTAACAAPAGVCSKDDYATPNVPVLKKPVLSELSDQQQLVLYLEVSQHLDVCVPQKSVQSLNVSVL
jgi:hypothetical protein